MKTFKECMSLADFIRAPFRAQYRDACRFARQWRITDESGEAQFLPPYGGRLAVLGLAMTSSGIVRAPRLPFP